MRKGGNGRGGRTAREGRGARSPYREVFFISIFAHDSMQYCNIHVTGVSQRRVVVPNKHGEKLVGVLHETGSKNLAILCHGFRASKVGCTLL